MKNLIHISNPLLASGLLGLLMTGCTTLDSVTVPDSVKVPFSKGKSVPTATLQNPAIRVMGLWQPGEGDGLDEGATGRGFVGQIYFFTGKSATPVAVDGDVRVYVFDDVGTLQEQKKPLHQFDFNDGAWQGYQSESAIGPCYNVYVPYTRKGNMEAKCHVRLRLKRPDGTQLFSELTEVQLDGIPRESSVMKRLRTTPEYDLNPDSEREWRAQAETIAIQKAGQFQRVPDEGQSHAAAQSLLPQMPGRKPAAGQKHEAPTLTPRTPVSKPQSAIHREAQIRQLEQKLIELHQQRRETPRELAPPQNAQEITPQAQFRELSSSRNIPDRQESEFDQSIQQLSFEAVPARREPPQYDSYERAQHSQAGPVSRADELRTILGVE